MALERRDPLPPGRYAIFINDDEVPRWSAWVVAHPSVKPIASIQKRAVGGSELTAIFHTDTDGNIIWENVGSSVLFEVTAPTPWVGLGLPSIEPRSVEAWAKEENENPEYIPDAAVSDQVTSLVLLGGGIYLFGIALGKVLR